MGETLEIGCDGSFREEHVLFEAEGVQTGIRLEVFVSVSASAAQRGVY